MRRWARYFLLATVLLAFAGVAGLAWMFAVRPGLDAYRAHAWPATPPGTGGLAASWHGTTAVLLDDGETRLFIDPFFTRPGGWPQLMLNRPIAPDEGAIVAGLREAGVTGLAAVLVTHSHYDHAMDAAVVARLTGADLLGSPSTANIGHGGGLPQARIRVAEPGRALQYGKFRVTFLRSRHTGATGGRPTGEIERPLTPPARYTDYRQGGTFGVLIEHPLGTVLHHGSAGWEPGMYEGRRAELVFLGIAAVPALEDYFRNVVDPLGARRVVPTHWDDFTRPLSKPLVPLPFGVDLEGFFAEATRLRPDLALHTLEPGRTVMLFESGAASD